MEHVGLGTVWTLRLAFFWRSLSCVTFSINGFENKKKNRFSGENNKFSTCSICVR